MRVGWLVGTVLLHICGCTSNSPGRAWLYSPLQQSTASAPPSKVSRQVDRKAMLTTGPQCTCNHIRYHSQNALSSRSDLLRCCRMPSTSRSLYLTLRISKSSCMDPVFRTVVGLGGLCRWGTGERHHLEREI